MTTLDALNWNDVQVFLIAMRSRSLRDVAKRLGISHATADIWVVVHPELRGFASVEPVQSYATCTAQQLGECRPHAHVDTRRR